ncbi:MAG: PAP/fibrillin family protein [Pseudomonadota bacterium]
MLKKALVTMVIVGCGLSSLVVADERLVAKSSLLDVLDAYEPGAPVTEAVLGAIDAAAAALEATAALPDLAANPGAAKGIWINRFSSQGVVGEIDLMFMTRALPGGGKPGRKATSLTVLQELDPEKRFYRNMMTMTAGDPDVPFLYIATADLGVAKQAPNVLEVAFHTIAFVPTRADVTPNDVRSALGVADNAPLSINVPQDPSRPPSTSTVTYLDDDLRINRGKDYIAILQRVQ